MIAGLGIDLIETRRVAREMTCGGLLTDEDVFTPAEITYCSAGKWPERRYAACFAAKEATLKALGTAVADLGIFHEVEVRHDNGNEPEIVLHGRLQAIVRRLGVQRIRLSIGDTRKRVGAMVILESWTEPRQDRIQI